MDKCPLSLNTAAGNCSRTDLKWRNLRLALRYDLGMDTAARLEEIKRTLSPDQLRYLTERVLCRTDAEAARNVGIAPTVIYHWPEKLLIQEAVNLMLSEGVEASREILRRALVDAARVKVDGLRSKRTSIKQAAATEILDRFHGKPKQAIEATVTADVSVKGYVTVSPDDWDEPNSDIPAASVADSPLA